MPMAHRATTRVTMHQIVAQAIHGGSLLAVHCLQRQARASKTDGSCTFGREQLLLALESPGVQDLLTRKAM